MLCLPVTTILSPLLSIFYRIILHFLFVFFALDLKVIQLPFTSILRNLFSIKSLFSDYLPVAKVSHRLLDSISYLYKKVYPFIGQKTGLLSVDRNIVSYIQPAQNNSHIGALQFPFAHSVFLFTQDHLHGHITIYLGALQILQFTLTQCKF